MVANVGFGISAEKLNVPAALRVKKGNEVFL